MLPSRRKEPLLTRAIVPAPCQVRSKTESPCPRRAAVGIRGVGFCGPCAREQEAYFAIGELVAREEARGPHGMPLTEALERVRRDRAGGTEGIIEETRRLRLGTYEAKPLALRNG